MCSTHVCSSGTHDTLSQLSHCHPLVYPSTLSLLFACHHCIGTGLYCKSDAEKGEESVEERKNRDAEGRETEYDMDNWRDRSNRQTSIQVDRGEQPRGRNGRERRHTS